jgi:hypothetical protein
MTRFSWLKGVLILLSMLAVACGEDEAGGCEGLCNRLCRMATDCIKSTSQDECYFKSTSADGSTQLQGRNVAGRGCEYGMVRDVCGDTTKPVALFSACAAALGQASCAVDDSRDVLVLPNACQGLLDCTSGPCLD